MMASKRSCLHQFDRRGAGIGFGGRELLVQSQLLGERLPQRQVVIHQQYPLAAGSTGDRDGDERFAVVIAPPWPSASPYACP